MEGTLKVSLRNPSPPLGMTNKGARLSFHRCQQMCSVPSCNVAVATRSPGFIAMVSAKQDRATWDYTPFVRN